MGAHRYAALEISSALMYSYEVLALEHRNAKERDDGYRDLLDLGPRDENANFKTTFALLLLNGALLEGTLRSYLSDRLLDDINEATKLGKERGQTKPTKPEQLLSKFHIDAEVQGGWVKLREQYAFYFDLEIDDVIGPALQEAMTAFTTLRNVLAHGTAIVYPSQKMDKTMEDVYPYSWQRKLTGASDYLEKNFRKGSIFKNLAAHEVPEHFMQVSQEVLTRIDGAVGGFTPRTARLSDLIRGYRFGYRINTN